MDPSGADASVRNTAAPDSWRQIDVVSVSPGKTGELNRAAIAAMRRAAAEKRVVSAIRLLDGGPSAVVVRVEVRGLAPLREAEVGTMYARSRK